VIRVDRSPGYEEEEEDAEEMKGSCCSLLSFQVTSEGFAELYNKIQLKEEVLHHTSSETVK